MKKTMTAVLFGLAMLLSGCATPLAKIAETPSGKPETTISGSETAAVKSLLISKMMDRGWTIEKDTDYVLEMTRAPRGMEDFAIALMAGNGYSDNQVVCSVNFARLPQGIRVVMTNSVRAIMPNGKVNNQPLDNNNQLFNESYTFLQQLRTEIEGSEAPASKATTTIAPMGNQ